MPTTDKKYHRAIRLLQKSIEIWDGNVKDKYPLAEQYFQEAKRISETFLLTEDEEEIINPF